MTQQAARRSPAYFRRQWLVTSSHKTVRRDLPGQPEVPHGVGHLRVLGSPRTACGIPSLNWPILWGLKVEDVPGVCPDCSWAVDLG